MRPKEMTKAGSCYIFYAKKPYISKEKTNRLGCLISKEVTMFVYAASALNPLSLVIRMSFYLLVQGGYLSHGIFIS